MVTLSLLLFFLLSMPEMSLLLAGPERSPSWAERRACQQQRAADRLASHLGDQADLDLRSVEIGVEDRDAVSRPCAVLITGGSGQQHDLVGDLRRRGPHFLPVNDVAA